MRIEKCKVCQVDIEDGSVVHFSFGKPGTLNRLQARVCQFVSEDRKEDCLNKNFSGEITDYDRYLEPNDQSLG